MKRSTSFEFLAHYGPWAVVAGASEGLGAEFAMQLAAKGLNLVLVARRADNLAEMEGRLRALHAVEVRVLSLDLAQDSAAEELQTFTRDVEVGLLVYNAAYSAIGPFWDTLLEDHLNELRVNCRTPLALAYAFGKRFCARGSGGLILMSSLSASQGSAFISNYAATKAYNQILAEGLWEEMREKGVDVLACCPGATATPNYIASLNGKKRHQTVAAMSPHDVVLETLAALGRQPSLIPGRMNRWAGFMMRRILPRQAAIRLMGGVLRNLYIEK